MACNPAPSRRIQRSLIEKNSDMHGILWSIPTPPQEYIFEGKIRGNCKAKCAGENCAKRDGRWVFKQSSGRWYICFEKLNANALLQSGLVAVAVDALEPFANVAPDGCVYSINKGPNKLYTFTITFPLKIEVAKLFVLFQEIRKDEKSLLSRPVIHGGTSVVKNTIMSSGALAPTDSLYRSTQFNTSPSVSVKRRTTPFKKKHKEERYVDVDKVNINEYTDENGENRPSSSQIFEEFAVDKENSNTRSNQPSTSRQLQPFVNRRSRLDGVSSKNQHTPINARTFYSNRNQEQTTPRNFDLPRNYQALGNVTGRLRKTGTRGILQNFDDTPRIKNDGRKVKNTHIGDDDWISQDIATPNAGPDQDFKGFSNLGNTCYLNAILQALFSVPCFAHGLNQIMNEKIIQDAISDDNLITGVLLRPLHCLYAIKDAYAFVDEKGKAIRELRKAIGSFAGEKFTGHVQQDAHELLVTVLDRVKEEVDAVKCERIINPVTDTFELQINHSIKCMVCDDVLNRLQPLHEMFIFPKESEERRSVQELLDYEFTTEQVEYKCEKCCKGGVDNTGALITRTIVVYPKVLNISISRYHFDADLINEGKITREIEIPKYVYLDAYSKDPQLKEGLEPYFSDGEGKEGQTGGGDIAEENKRQSNISSDDPSSPELFSQESISYCPKRVLPQNSTPNSKQGIPIKRRRQNEDNSVDPMISGLDDSQSKNDDKALQLVMEESRRAFQMEQDRQREEQMEIEKAMQESLLEADTPYVISDIVTDDATPPFDVASFSADFLVKTPVLNRARGDNSGASNAGEENDARLEANGKHLEVDGKNDRDEFDLTVEPEALSTCSSSCVVELVEEVTCPEFNFDPVDESWQKEKCKIFNIPFKRRVIPSRQSPNLMVSRTAPPCETRSMEGDGNCFFRGISYWISGDQNNHEKVRSKIVDFERNHSKSFFRTDRKQGLDKMEENGEWSTQNEVLAAATLLNTTIYTYSKSSSIEKVYSWTQFNPQFTDESKVSKFGVYLYHMASCHYDVVLSVHLPLKSEKQDSDLKEFPPNTYQLIGVVSHIGDSGSRGHYICDCFVNGAWHSCDDCKVEPVKEEVVLTQRRDIGYIFFYARKEIVEDTK